MVMRDKTLTSKGGNALLERGDKTDKVNAWGNNADGSERQAVKGGNALLERGDNTNGMGKWATDNMGR